MERIFSLALAACLLIGWTLSGCVFVEHKGDRGLHKGHYKEQQAPKSRDRERDTKGRY